ncbi:Piso0_002540 [Millerozyma farinosa CBS 7064]|uniref:Piso0_002540 protein n=1 Tax=Pichia sorbitophila (strain ATCC MYA-4447 / BCRC 22081 / CBS 7064 / NBRC 10061 / NRRL Y-12695) TaxID=559304 RepID=G8YFB4_PICSO|nr:Piso0_002540 [Millerozyma farinosa CBS 7064]
MTSKRLPRESNEDKRIKTRVDNERQTRDEDDMLQAFKGMTIAQRSNKKDSQKRDISGFTDHKTTYLNKGLPKDQKAISEDLMSRKTIRPEKMKNGFTKSMKEDDQQNVSNAPKIVSTFKKVDYSSLSKHKKGSGKAVPLQVPKAHDENSTQEFKVWDRYRDDGNRRNLKPRSTTRSHGSSLLSKSQIFNNLQDDSGLDTGCSSVEAQAIDKSRLENLKVELLPHQVKGLQFLLHRESFTDEHCGGILADEMGLGKTVQIIALLVYNKLTQKNKPTLIVCPVSLINQWKLEIETKAKGLVAYAYNRKEKLNGFAALAKYDVVIISYNTLASEYSKHGSSPFFDSKSTWHRVVLDEAHQVKNMLTKQNKAVCDLEAKRRWCLTGTPIQNGFNDLRALFKFLRIGPLSKDEQWMSRVASHLKEGNEIDIVISEIRSQLQELMLRRTKKVLDNSQGFKLPEKRTHRVIIDFSEFEKLVYSNMKAISNMVIKKSRLIGSSRDVPSKVSANTKKTPHTKKVKSSYSRLSLLVHLLRLRQACCSWNLIASNKAEIDVFLKKLEREVKQDNLESLIEDLDSFEIKDDQEIVSCSPTQQSSDLYLSENMSSKTKQMLEIVKKDKSRKTIIFSQFTSLFPIFKDILKSHEIDSLIFDGSMDISKRSTTLDKFRNSNRHNVLLCSLKCGSVGLNLTCASRVILFDPWWNPQIQEQAIDRVYRIGQKSSVDIYELIIRGTVEEKILLLQEKKRMLAGAIMLDTRGPDMNTNRLTMDELYDLISSENF